MQSATTSPRICAALCLLTLSPLRCLIAPTASARIHPWPIPHCSSTSTRPRFPSLASPGCQGSSNSGSGSAACLDWACSVLQDRVGWTTMRSQHQAQALAVQSQIAAGLYPGLDLSACAAASHHAAHSVPAAAPAPTAESDHNKSASPSPRGVPNIARRPGSSHSQRESLSGSEFEFDALKPSHAALAAAGLGVGLAGYGAEKRSVVPLKAAPPALAKEEDEMSVDERDEDEDEAQEKPVTRLPPVAPVEPRLGMRTPGMPAKLGSSSGLYPTLPAALSSPPSSKQDGEKITLPGIVSLLSQRPEPSYRLRPVSSTSARRRAAMRTKMRAAGTLQRLARVHRPRAGVHLARSCPHLRRSR